MTKRKKLKCVGWGIIMFPNEPANFHIYPKVGETEVEVIEMFNDGESMPDLKYSAYLKEGTAIAKKLWVELDNKEGK